MDILDVIEPRDVIASLKATAKVEVLREMATHLCVDRPDLEARELVGLLMDRERLGSTGVGQGVAIPHCKYPGLGDIVGLLARSPEGVDFDAVDKSPVHLFFVLLVPAGASNDYLKVLAKISTLVRNKAFQQAMAQLENDASITDLYKLLMEFGQE